MHKHNRFRVSSVSVPDSLNPDPAFWLNTNPDPDPDPDPYTLHRVLMTKYCKKFTSEKKIHYDFDQKCILIPRTINDVHTTGEDFSPQKRTSSNSKYEIS